MYKLVIILVICFTNLQSSLIASNDELDKNQEENIDQKIAFEDTMYQINLSIFNTLSLKANLLTTIELSNHHLRFLPDLTGFSQLRYLILSNNQLDDSTHFQLPTSLVSLDLDCNQLSVFPSILNCENLRFIKLQENRINYLPKELPFPNLERLFLTANPVAQKTDHLTQVINNRYLPINVEFCTDKGNYIRRIRSVEKIRTCESDFFG